MKHRINWPASSVWVFIAQLVEHCGANAEAMGSNLVKAPKNFFFLDCLNIWDSLQWFTYSSQSLSLARFLFLEILHLGIRKLIG